MKKKILWQGKFLRVVGKDFFDRKGNRHVWECVERTNARKIVAIFAVTEKKEVLLVKQYRYPQEEYVVELPAGLADRKNESLGGTAKRELLEETGYRAKKLKKILEGPTSAGITNEYHILYFAPDVSETGNPNVKMDDSEEIELMKVPLSRLVDFCCKKHNGFSVDLKILGSLKMLEEENLI